MTITSTVARPTEGTRVVEPSSSGGQTFWPAHELPVPTQLGPGSHPSAARGVPMPSLRGMGVDPRSLAQPRTKVRTTVLRCSSSVLCAAQHLLEQPVVPGATLAEVVESDPVLVLRVLHLANLQLQHGHRADTVPQGIEVLGARTLASLVNELLLEATVGATDGMWRALARGLTCELLSGDRVAFTAGVLSGLADALGVPPEIVFEVAGVSREVVDAMRTGSGAWGPALRAVVAYERNDVSGVVRSGLTPVNVYDAYLRGSTEAMATATAVGTN